MFLLFLTILRLSVLDPGSTRTARSASASRHREDTVATAYGGSRERCAVARRGIGPSSGARRECCRLSTYGGIPAAWAAMSESSS